MGITSFIGMGIALVIIGMVVLILKADKRYTNQKPYPLSLISLTLIIINWILYLFGFYAFIPEKTGDVIFLPVWILVSIIGFIATYKESTNNRIFSVVTVGLSIISFIIGMLAWGIGNM